jgi:hypothetical protein
MLQVQAVAVSQELHVRLHQVHHICFHTIICCVDITVCVVILYMH